MQPSLQTNCGIHRLFNKGADYVNKGMDEDEVDIRFRRSRCYKTKKSISSVATIPSIEAIRVCFYVEYSPAVSIYHTLVMLTPARKCSEYERFGHDFYISPIIYYCPGLSCTELLLELAAAGKRSHAHAATFSAHLDALWHTKHC